MGDTQVELKQHEVALVSANEVRLKRAKMKRDVRAGTRSPRAIVLLPPPYARNMKVVDLLMSLPRWGSHRSENLLRTCHIGPTRTLADLTDRQREALAEHLR